MGWRSELSEGKILSPHKDGAALPVDTDMNQVALVSRMDGQAEVGKIQDARILGFHPLSVDPPILLMLLPLMDSQEVSTISDNGHHKRRLINTLPFRLKGMAHWVMTSVICLTT